MAKDKSGLSRRERQIMDVIYAKPSAAATVAQVREALPEAPSYSAVRAMLRILEEKRHLQHREVEGKYVYSPTRPRSRAAKHALQRVLRTFFENSATKAVAALLDSKDAKLDETELDELSRLIEDAKRRGGKS
jgi:predicted transcriptional regulator